ncbi:hypothetical protein DV736_g109, partial [Chaetothyriales sp. CBS 134916]
MSRISIPLDAITSRLNLQDRFNSVSSQSMAARFANLKPVSEFLDLKRLSKPNNFAEIQTRVNYNLAYFSSNYAVVFVMLAIYSLITNPWLLFDIIFVAFGMWFIGKLKGGDLEIGTIKATTSQLYTGLLCIAVPIAFFSGPFATLLWLIGASGVTILGGRPRAPFEAPLSEWGGRPPGARLGRSQRAWHAHQSWSEYDDRFEELETDDDGLLGVELDPGYAQKRFLSDDLRAAGVHARESWPTNQRHTWHFYDDDDYTLSDEDYAPTTDLVRRGQAQAILREKENALLERALERIRRARALGKREAKLSPAEIDLLERSGYLPPQPQPPVAAPAKSSPKGKQTATATAKSKQKKAEVKKPSAKKDTSSSGSPRPKSIEATRARRKSTASSRSKNDNRSDAMVPYPLPPEDRAYPAAYYARQSAPPSRQNSGDPSMQGWPAQPQYPTYPYPYYAHPQSRYVSNPERYGYRSHPSSNSLRTSRPDPTDPDWEPRTRSTSSLVSYPIDQLPSQGQGRAPRFDPLDPRFASPPPSRRVSGQSGSQQRRQPDELFRPEGPQLEVMSYLAVSSDESDGEEGEGEEESSDTSSGQGVRVEVEEEEEKPAVYAIETRSRTAVMRAERGGRGSAAARKRK